MANGERGPFGAGRAGRVKRGRWARPLAEILEGRQLLATIAVTSAGDADGADGGSTLSLRQAIEVSNGTLAVSSLTAAQKGLVVGALSSPNTIDFDIPGAGPFTIEPTSALPAITSPAVIDGYSQPGARPNTNGPGLGDNAAIRVEIDGDKAGPGTSGLDLKAGATTVTGLAIGGFAFLLGTTTSTGGDGIMIEGPGDLIAGNFIGTTADGSTAVGDQARGIEDLAPAATIGGTAPAARNLISGNATDIDLADSDNLVEGNLIGTDVTGTRPLPNGFSGVGIGGAGNTVGGTTAGARNVIGGGEFGVEIFGPGDLVEGNFIGTDVTGTLAIPNLFEGIEIAGTDSDTIGGTAAGAGNLISGNGNNGLLVVGSGNLVQGNLIGTDATGARPLPNGSGIAIEGDSDTIGGTAAAARNVISGNAGGGLSISPFSASSDSGNLVQGNFIGTDATGTGPLPNAKDGLDILGSNSNTIGGSTAGAGNIISGNDGNGIEITFSNYPASGGGGGGIGGIGGIAPAVQNLIEGNSIGTDPAGAALPNADDGVLVAQSSSNTIGGTAAGAANVIAFNGQAGVAITTPNVGLQPTQGDENTISGNSIHGNGALGIDLGGDGVTPNNPAGSPTGPNRLQPYPVLTSSGTTTTGTAVVATLDATPSTSYTVEFFANPAADPSGFGQGQVYLGSTLATTDASGHASFIFSTPSDLAGQFISATATDPMGDTSEFARDLAVIATTTQLTLGQPAPTAAGQPLTLVATVTPAVPTSSAGLVTFSEDGQAIGVEGLNAASSATLTIPALGGSHTFTAIFTALNGYGPSASAPVVVTVGNPAQAPTTTLIGPSAASVFGRPVTFAAVVAPATPGGPVPTGMVVFAENGVILGQAPLNAQGVAVLITNAVPTGLGAVAAVYTGDSSNAVSLSNYITANIQPTSPLTVLVGPTSPVKPGRPITLTATVYPTVGDSTPTGIVFFAEDGVILGEAALDASGVAVLVTEAIPLGDQAVAAGYLGDASHTVSLSNYLTVRVRSTAHAVKARSIKATAVPAHPSGPKHPARAREGH